MSSPTPSLNNDPSLAVSGVAQLEDMDRMMESDDEDDSFVLVENPSSSTTATSSTQALESARTNATLQVRRTAHRHSLNPYSASELNHFASEDHTGRQLLTYGLLLSIRHQVGVLASPTGAYVVPKPLMDNLKDYSIASLLSPKLPTYKGALPGQRVLAVIKHVNVNVPNNLDTDRHILNAVQRAISDELTQCRSRIKKAIATSRKSNQSIFDLASTLVEGTQCTVTVALSARLALLRKVHAEAGKSDAKFWDHVNDRLAEATAKAADRDDPQAALQRYFQKTLKADRELYKNGSLHAPTQVVNAWQDTVDDILADGVATPPNTTSTNTTPAPTASGSGDAGATPADSVSA